MTEDELKAIDEKLAAIDALSWNDWGTAAELNGEKDRLRAAMWPSVRLLVAEVRRLSAPAPVALPPPVVKPPEPVEEPAPKHEESKPVVKPKPKVK